MTTTAILSIVSVLKKLISFITNLIHEKHEAEIEEEIVEANDELHEACDHGQLSDLINVANKMEDIK